MDREPTHGYQLYFAYGSNMLEQRLKERVKSAKFLCNAWISSYVVQCRKMSIDGSGKADLVDMGLPEDIVYGVVYEIDPADWFELDKHEGAAGNNPGYERVPIRVYTDSAAIDVATYLARKERIDESLKPYTWYRDLILRGAEQHSLPEDYLQKIVKILDIRDPVENRPEKIEAERQIKKYLASIDH